MTPCKEWVGSKSKSGYGLRRRKKGKTRYIHRITWIKKHGPIPDGMVVCHKCDNRLCYNLEHLFLGTHSENMKDMHDKGRGGDTSVKLTEEDVIWIRANEGILTQGEMARTLGVDPATISRVLLRKTWRNI